MEYRKLISFGKNSYVVSLPKVWVKQNKLKKGDLVSLEEKGNNLLLSMRDDKEIEEKTKVIPVDGKSVRRLQREIISAYIRDYKSIVLTGNEIKDKAQSIQSTIQNLMALEVMEQTSKKILARDFLDMNTISIFNLLRKVDVILRAMIEDCEKMFVEDNYDSIELRDSDINRLVFLIFRTVEFGMGNASFMLKKHNLTSQQLLHLWWFAFNMESTADEVKRIARYMKQVKLDKKQQEGFLKLLSGAKDKYTGVMKAFYNHDEDLAHAMLESKEEVIRACELFYQENKKVENLGVLVERLKSIISGVHNLARVVYQSDFVPS
jgi:phosphate uptake regulator